MFRLFFMVKNVGFIIIIDVAHICTHFRIHFLDAQKYVFISINTLYVII